MKFYHLSCDGGRGGTHVSDVEPNTQHTYNTMMGFNDW